MSGKNTATSLGYRRKGRLGRSATDAIFPANSRSAKPEGDGPSRYAAGRMPSLDDTFTHLAELAVALAGFVGVVSAFAGRNRDYTTLERGRTVAVGVSAGSVLAGSLAYTTISTGGFDSSVAIRSSAAISFLLIFAVLAPVQLGAAKALFSRQAKQPWVFAASLVVWSLNLGLLGFSMVPPGNALTLVAAFSVQLLVGFWMFMRLLLHAD